MIIKFFLKTLDDSSGIVYVQRYRQDGVFLKTFILYRALTAIPIHRLFCSVTAGNHDGIMERVCFIYTIGVQKKSFIYTQNTDEEDI